MKHLTPEQMKRRWLALGIVALAYVLSFFQRFAPAGIANDLAAAFDTSAASLGVLAATYFYVYTVMQVPTGMLADTLGPRRILMLGGVIGGIGSFMFGLAPTLDIALVAYAVYRMLLGTDLSDELKRLACPVLVIGGALDRVRPAAGSEALARTIPGARYRELLTGHYMAVQTPELIADAIVEFLASVEA